MTPPPLDGRMIVVKLVVMRQLLDHLDVLDAPVPLAVGRLEQDWAVRYAVERILTQLVETAASINAHVAVAVLGRGADSYRDSFLLLAEAGAVARELAVRLAPSAGMRNVLVHAYADVDLSKVVDGVALARRDYRAYVTALADWLPG